jgi:hypothetical protein
MKISNQWELALNDRLIVRMIAEELNMRKKKKNQEIYSVAFVRE